MDNATYNTRQIDRVPRARFRAGPGLASWIKKDLANLVESFRPGRAPSRGLFT